MLEFKTYNTDDRFTATIIREKLEAEGIRVAWTAENPTHRLCWGIGAPRTIPVLNARAGRRSKLEQLKLFFAADILTPKVLLWNGRQLEDLHGRVVTAPKFPLLARVGEGCGGKGIMPALQQEDVEWRAAAGARFFSEYVPIEKEVRVWAFRGRPLHSGIKVMRSPEKYCGLGRNYKDGFVFESWEAAPEAVDLTVRAIAALGLDFGASDICLGKDGKWRLFELNTAPGVAGRHSMFASTFVAAVAAWYRGRV